MEHSHLTHLHVHSHFTLLGGTPSIEQLIARAVEDGLSALALTDTQALYGAVAFARACNAAAIHPIVGMMTAVQPPEDLVSGRPEPLVLLAKDATGYRSLCRLSSAIQNHPDREARLQRGLAWDDLRGNHTGLLAIAGGRHSWIAELIRTEQEGTARRLCGRIAGLFDEGQTFLALELHGPDDHATAAAIIDIGRRLGLPPVAVQPVYTLHPAERQRMRLLAAIRLGCTVAAVPATACADESVDLHWLTPEELSARFADYPAALDLIGEIAGCCTPCLPDGNPIWPVAFGGDDPTISAQQRLDDLCRAGLHKQYGENVSPPIQARLRRELEIIGGHGYAPLFLLVADIVAFARRQGIPVSTRGSVANSLVAFCLEITDVDPIEHDLLFERFLNPARRQLPDIDLDFCSRRRDEVLAYVRSRYGEERTALVATVNTFQPRSAVRETAKAYGLSDADAGKLARRIRQDWHPDPRRRQTTSQEDLAAGLGDPLQQEIVRQAYGLVGMPHHISIHAGGLVVTPGPLTDYVPLQLAPKGFTITQFDHDDVESLGLIKVDLLGIRALTVLNEAVALVRRRHDPEFQLPAIGDDSATGDLLEQGETIGVFQCESSGAQRTLRQLRARTAHDLAVANAFFKPGPATGGMADAFVRRYRGEAEVTYLHPALAPILQPTQGVLLFQEQILRVATEIAGLSWAEADHLRRGMSKFRADEMARLRHRFVAGCQRLEGPQLSEAQANTLYEQIAAFAGYGFNQGHATAYAAVSYRSAYLRAHFPAEFLCARLAEQGGFHHQAVYIAEAKRLGIPVLPPHVNYSGRHFTLADRPATSGRLQASLYMGLGQVRDLRRQSVKSIVHERRQRPFTGLRDLLARIDLQPKEIDHLIRCGALDGLGSSRAALLHEAGEIRRAGNVEQLGFGFLLPEVPAESTAERLAWETRILGQPLSSHPIEQVDLPTVQPLSAAVQRPNRPVAVAGVRLPGWTGGRGFFLDDGHTYVIAMPTTRMAAPKIWQPVVVAGRWCEDGWGSGWLQVEEMREVRGLGD